MSLFDRLGVTAELPPGTRRRAQPTRIQAFIERHLADSTLSPSDIAAAHHVSLRHLYKLFESHGHSVSGRIRQRRLERRRRDLADPALAEQPVSAVAARWGLVNAAHFSRSFRATYGVSPLEYRITSGLRRR